MTTTNRIPIAPRDTTLHVKNTRVGLDANGNSLFEVNIYQIMPVVKRPGKSPPREGEFLLPNADMRWLEEIQDEPDLPEHIIDVTYDVSVRTGTKHKINDKTKRIRSQLTGQDLVRAAAKTDHGDMDAYKVIEITT